MATGTTGLLTAKWLSAANDLTIQTLRDGFDGLMDAGGNIAIHNTRNWQSAVDAGLQDTRRQYALDGYIQRRGACSV